MAQLSRGTLKKNITTTKHYIAKAFENYFPFASIHIYKYIFLTNPYIYN